MVWNLLLVLLIGLLAIHQYRRFLPVWRNKPGKGRLAHGHTFASKGYALDKSYLL